MAENDGAITAPGINIAQQYVKDLSFENPGAPQVFLEMGQAPQVGLDINIEINPLQPPELFEVVLNLRAEAKRDDRGFFLAELAYGCVVALSNVPEEHVRPVLMVEVPRLLFPFARAIISDVTRDGGFPALVLNPIDFMALYQQRLVQEAAETQGQA